MDETMKKFLALLPIFWIGAAQAVLAQSWCPPGAEWSHESYSVDWSTGDTYVGVVISRFSGDTIVDGQETQRNRATSYIHEEATPDSTIISPFIADFHMRQMDGVVYLLHPSPYEFDTVMWFTASPGDHWSWPGQETGAVGTTEFVVVDTGSVQIDGLNLRRLIVHLLGHPFVGQVDTLGTDTLIERIGFNYFYLIPDYSLWVSIDGPLEGLRCYRDNDITYTTAPATPCGFSTSINEQVRPTGIQVFPNPGAEVLHVETEARDLTTVRVFDGMGRAVLIASNPNGSFVLNSSGLASGIYLVELDGIAGRRTVKWMKQ